MRPILFWCGRMPVYSYAAMLYLGIVLGIFTQLGAATAVGVDPNRALLATLMLLLGALAGARLMFVACEWRSFRPAGWRGMLRAAEGGAAMYGGLIVAVPLSVPLLSALRLPFSLFWDLASFTMLVGLIFARAGCLLSGCCAGRASERWFAMNLPDSRGVWRRRIPTQLAEAIWALVVLSGAAIVWSRGAFAGSVFLFTLGAYGAGRTVLETAREQQDRFMGVRLHRVLSVLLVVTALVGYGAHLFG